MGERTRLRDVGIDRRQLDRLVEPSLEKLKAKSVSGNIRPVDAADHVREIVKLAWCFNYGSVHSINRGHATV